MLNSSRWFPTTLKYCACLINHFFDKLLIPTFFRLPHLASQPSHIRHLHPLPPNHNTLSQLQPNFNQSSKSLAMARTKQTARKSPPSSRPCCCHPRHRHHFPLLITVTPTRLNYHNIFLTFTSQVNPPEAKPLVSSWPQRPLAKPPHQPVVSRSLIVISPVPSLSGKASPLPSQTHLHRLITFTVRSVATRNPPSS